MNKDKKELKKEKKKVLDTQTVHSAKKISTDETSVDRYLEEYAQFSFYARGKLRKTA